MNKPKLIILQFTTNKNSKGFPQEEMYHKRKRNPNTQLRKKNKKIEKSGKQKKKRKGEDNRRKEKKSKLLNRNKLKRENGSFLKLKSSWLIQERLEGLLENRVSRVTKNQRNKKQNLISKTKK